MIRGFQTVLLAWGGRVGRLRKQEDTPGIAKACVTLTTGGGANGRPRVYRWLVVVMILGMLSATLGGGPPAGAQSRGNILGVAMHFYPSTFDPAIGVAGTHYRIFVNTYEGLVDYKIGTANIVPALAQSWSVSTDLTTFTFRLRPNVRFHDGSTMDAEAVKLSFDRVKKIGQGPSVYLRSMREIQAVDPQTVRIVTDPAVGHLLVRALQSLHPRQDPRDRSHDGRAWFAANINGTRPVPHRPGREGPAHRDAAALDVLAGVGGPAHRGRVDSDHSRCRHVKADARVWRG